MASLPKSDPLWVPMTAEELLAIRGTAAFDEEYGRQGERLAEHQRMHPEELLEVDEEDLAGWS